MKKITSIIDSSRYHELNPTAVENREDYFQGISARRKFMIKNNPSTKIKEVTRIDDQLNWSK